MKNRCHSHACIGCPFAEINVRVSLDDSHIEQVRPFSFFLGRRKLVRKLSGFGHDATMGAHTSFMCAGGFFVLYKKALGDPVRLVELKQVNTVLV